MASNDTASNDTASNGWVSKGRAPNALLTPLRAVVAALAATVLAVGAVAQSAVPAPEKFSCVLWSGDQARGIARAQALGCDALQLGRGADPAPLRAAGLGFYLDQPIGKGLLELRDEEWRPLVLDYERQRDPATLVRPTCFATPGVLDAAVTHAAAEVARVVGPGLRFVALADEASATRHDAPLDTCACEACRAAFVTFLRRELGNLDAINLTLGTQFAALEDVRPVSTDQVRRRELGDTSLPADLRAFVLRQQFVAQQFADAVNRLAGAVAAAAPGVPVGLTGLQVPAAFGGNDYARLLPKLTLLEAYEIGGAVELAASLGRRDAHRYATLFPPPQSDDQGPRPNSAQYVRHALVDAAAHGLAGVVVWNDETVFDVKDQPTPFGAALRDELQRLRPILDACAGAHIEPGPVWMLESQPSVALWWMLDSAKDGMTWVRRLASYERTHSTSQTARRAWLRLLQDLGHQPQFVAVDDLATRLLQERPRCLVLPASIALADRTAQAIGAYVRSGGTVLADHSTGIYDESGRRRAAGALDELFGIDERSLRWDDLLVREGQALRRLDERLPAAERGLRGRLGERRDDTTVFLEQRLGRGRAVYLNAPVVGYVQARLDEGAVGFAFELRRRVRAVLQEAGVAPPCDVRGEGLPTCVERVPLRLRDGRAVLAIRIEAKDRPALLARLADQPRRRIVVSFARERTLRMLDGRELGRAVNFDLPFDPFGALFLEVVDL